MIPYIPSPKLRAFGIGLFLLGVLSGVALGVAHHFSGEIVGVANTIKPLPQTDIIEQSLQAQSQALLQNKMNEMGVSAFRTDKIQKLNMSFMPIYLSPDMSPVQLQFEIYTNGVVASGNLTSIDQAIKRRSYQLVHQASGKIVFQHESKHFFPSHVDEKENTAKIIINGNSSKVTLRKGLKYITVGFVNITEAGNYTLHAEIEKYKYAFPIELITLTAKKNVMPVPSLSVFAMIIGSILVGTVICVLTARPELRNKKRPHARL